MINVEYVPDNYDLYAEHEREIARQERLQRKREIEDETTDSKIDERMIEWE